MRGYNKRGWIRILEATIAVLIVSTTLVVVYSNQQATGEDDASEFIFNLQRQVLADIATRSDLRGHVLNGSAGAILALDSYVDTKVPDAFRYSIKICDLGNVGACKLNSTEVAETNDLDVFSEETVVSADFGEGFEPKKVRLFIWENR